MKVVRIFLILTCFLFSCGSETVFAANYRQQTSPQEAVPKKKSHKWLIPVGIGAGFAIGTLVGLSAYDDAINSDQKVWTTAILSAAAGGFAGWAVSHHLDKPSKSAFRWNPSPNPTDAWQASVDPQCFPRQRLTLKHQADCLVPPYMTIPVKAPNPFAFARDLPRIVADEADVKRIDFFYQRKSAESAFIRG